MVFFVCEGCNESLKKNQVDKHVTQCANCYVSAAVPDAMIASFTDYGAGLT